MIESQVKPQLPMTAGYRLPLFICKKCGESKPKEMFTKSANCKHGIKYICKVCQNKKRLQNKAYSRSYLERIENSNSGVKKCSKCLQVKELKYYYPRGKYYTSMCMLCCKEKNKESKQKYREKIKLSEMQWRLNNKNKVKEYKKKSFIKNKDKIYAYRERVGTYKDYMKDYQKGYCAEKIKIKDIKFYNNRRKNSKINREKATDGYVRHILKMNGVKSPDKELIDTYRIIIKTKRLCKTLENSEKS